MDIVSIYRFFHKLYTLPISIIPRLIIAVSAIYNLDLARLNLTGDVAFPLGVMASLAIGLCLTHKPYCYLFGDIFSFI